MLIGEPESDATNVVELLPDASDEPQDLCIRVDHGSSGHGKSAGSGATNSALFIHEKWSEAEVLGGR
jgi:hypothetical protein